MQKEKMTPEESLNIIGQAINTAHKETTGAAYYLILWGALLTFFFLIHFIHAFGNTGDWLMNLGWLVFPVGGLLSWWHTRKTDAVEKTKPVYDSVYLYAWGGVALCLGIVSLVTSVKGPGNVYIFVLLLLFSLAAFITGGVSKFYPSLAGGVAGIVLSALILITKTPYHYLCAAAGIVVACLLPGLLLHAANKRKHA